MRVRCILFGCVHERNIVKALGLCTVACVISDSIGEAFEASGGNTKGKILKYAFLTEVSIKH